MYKSKMKKSFTLVEMLIVVVIIGILAAALLPRLVGAQEKARDTARKGHLNNLTTSLTSYYNDIGVYTGDANTKDMKDIENDLVPKYMTSIPTDPQNQRTIKLLAPTGTSVLGTPGQYAYSPMMKNGNRQAGMIVGANVEGDGPNANFVLDSNFNSDLNTGITRCNSQCGASTLAGGAIKNGSGADSTDVSDLVRVMCNTGVVLNTAATATSLQNCVGKDDNSVVYIVAK